MFLKIPQISKENTVIIKFRLSGNIAKFLRTAVLIEYLLRLLLFNKTSGLCQEPQIICSLVVTWIAWAEAVAYWWSKKRVLWQILQNSQEKACNGCPFLVKVEAYNFFKKQIHDICYPMNIRGRSKTLATSKMEHLKRSILDVAASLDSAINIANYFNTIILQNTHVLLLLIRLKN